MPQLDQTSVRRITGQLQDASEILGGTPELLSAERSIQLFSEIAASLGLEPARGWWWESHSVGPPKWQSAQLTSDAWRRFSDVLPRTMLVVFVENDPSFAFRVESEHLSAVLGECEAIEFLAVCDCREFALFFNHHEYAIACNAASWFEQLPRYRADSIG